MVNLVNLDGSPLTGTTTGKYDIEDKYSGQFNPVLITIGALCWFEDLGRFFEKVALVLKEGGVLLIMVLPKFFKNTGIHIEIGEHYSGKCISALALCASIM